jgi:chemotaxis protein MotB
MAESQPPIIIKKIKKKAHAAHHGGAWKVAYADFVTAMMAFFLVLWLLSVLSEDTRDAVAEYYRSYSILSGTEAGGVAPIPIMTGAPIQIDSHMGDTKVGARFDDPLKLKLASLMEKEMEGLKDQVLISVTNEGIRIELVEKYGKPMFQSGTADLVEEGYDVLWIIGAALKESGSKIAIEGHTDSGSTGYDDYTNWELAADRANSARRALLEGGVLAGNIAKVTSYADTVPLDPRNPSDEKNRRVSILVLHK